MKKQEINIHEIEEKIGYVFKDKSLLIQAFTRTSFCNENIPSTQNKYQSNEVLEFFGDGVLSVAIISFLLKECTVRYAYGIKTDLDEGDFSNIKSKLSDKQNLSKSMRALGLQKHLRMGEGDTKLGIQDEPSVMEDLFESIVGAIYIDSDMSMSAVISSVSRMLDMSVYTNRQKAIQSAKNALQEWCADKKRRLPTPRYETLSEDGPDHKKTYMRGCYIGDRLVGRGIGKNFKIADAAAAEDALKAILAENSSDMTTKVVEHKSNKPPTTQNTPISSSAQNIQSAKDTVPTKEKNASDPAEVLRSYASSQKKPSAIFKDLGEIKRSGATIYRVNCLFLDEVTTGEGRNRSEARENAALLMIDRIGIGKKKKSSAKASSTRLQNSQTAKPNAKADPIKNNANNQNGKATSTKGKKNNYSQKKGKKPITKK